MSPGGTTKEAARQALLDIQRYLADEIAPLMAVDAARELLRLPAKYGAVAIEHWLQGQLSAPDRAVTVSTYLYHAVKKIHLFSEFKLIESTAMDSYVAQLSRLVIRFCPEREQAELRLRLSRIGESGPNSPRRCGCSTVRWEARQRSSRSRACWTSRNRRRNSRAPRARGHRSWSARASPC